MRGSFTRRATAKAALLITGSTYVAFIFSLATSALVARALGPEDFGRYAYVVWISGLLVSIGNNGISTTGIRFISESLGGNLPETARSIHGWLRRLQLICVAATVIGFLLTFRLIVPPTLNDYLLICIAVICVSAIAKAIYLFDISIAKGHGRYEVEAYPTLILSGASFAGILVMYLVGAPLNAYLLFFVLSSVAYTVVAWRMLGTRGIVPLGRTVEEKLLIRMKAHLAWTIVLAIAAALSNKSIETYLLSSNFGPEQVGFFTIAVGLTRGGVELLSSGLNTVLMPLMGHAYGEGGANRVNWILANAVRYFTFAGLLLAGVGFLWADIAITLMYGTEYRPATEAFRYMVVAGGIILSYGAFGALLSTTDNQRIRAYSAVVALVICFVVAFLLVPRYGLLGAAAANAVSSIIIFLMIGFGVIKMFKVVMPWSELGRLILAASIAAGIAGSLFLVSVSLFAQFMCGVAYSLILLIGSIAFKAWRSADAEQLMPLAKRFPGTLGVLVPLVMKWLIR